MRQLINIALKEVSQAQLAEPVMENRKHQGPRQLVFAVMVMRLRSEPNRTVSGEIADCKLERAHHCEPH
jgi:hypothetical protein